MSLDSRLASLISAIGADIKTLMNRTVDQHNASITTQTGFATDTYLAGSSIAIPQGKIKVGTKYRLKFNVSKTNAGTAAPVISIRVGTAGAVTDIARAALTYGAQTAVVDDGEFEIECAFRGAAASAVIQAIGNLLHRLSNTGLSNATVFSSVKNTGASFDSTPANLKIGASVNAGTSAAWTIDLVSAELVNLAP